MATGKCVVLNLYRQLLRESSKFTAYNYRSYFIRRVKEEFRRNRLESNQDKVNELLRFGEENLQIIKRQVLIGRFYQTNPLVIEKTKVNPT